MNSRDKLKAIHHKEHHAREAANAARVLHDKDRDQVERAQAMVSSHQAALQKLDADEATSVGSDGLPLPPSPGRTIGSLFGG
jgi:hypothetical protein